jgi:hypothetical protein
MAKKYTLEFYTYLFVLGLLFFSQIFIGILLVRFFPESEPIREFYFGFNQFKLIGLRGILVGAILISLVWAFRKKINSFLMSSLVFLEEKKWRVHLFIWLTAILAGIVFFSFSTGFINPDAKSFERKFNRVVPVFGAHVTHDEMWELFFHSRFWLYTNQTYGWDVNFSYRVVSSVMGAFFILALLYYARQKRQNDWAGFAILICSGGYMQLFFGDVENYTMTALFVFIYLWVADLYIQNKVNLWLACLLLVIAMSFHLLSGFLLPSLLYLFYLSYQRQQIKEIILGIFLIAGLMVANLIFFTNYGLPIENLWTASFASGQGGNYQEFLVIPNLNYYSEIINLLFLIAPFWILMIPLLIFKRVKGNENNLFLVFSIMGMLCLLFGWKAQLGVYNDWNLFAISALPISLFIWNNSMNLPDSELKVNISILAGFVFSFHTLIWIYSNYLLRL